MTSLIRKSDILISPAASSHYGDTMTDIDLPQTHPNDKNLTKFTDISNITVEAAGVLLSLSTIWVVAGKGTLVASLVASMPTWQGMDPLYVVTDSDKHDEPAKIKNKLDKIDYIFDGKSAREKLRNTFLANSYSDENRN